MKNNQEKCSRKMQSTKYMSKVTSKEWSPRRVAQAQQSDNARKKQINKRKV